MFRFPHAFDLCVCVCVSRLVVSNSLRSHGLGPARPLCPWHSPGKNTGVGCNYLLHLICNKEQNFKLSYLDIWFQFSSVQSLSLVWLFATPESQYARPPCPSPTPRVHWDSRPSSQWCHPAISSSVVPFSSCPQSLPASESFQWVNSSHEVAKVLEFQL